MDYLILLYGLLISLGLFLYGYGVAMLAIRCLKKDYTFLYYLIFMIGVLGVPFSILASFVV